MTASSAIERLRELRARVYATLPVSPELEQKLLSALGPLLECAEALERIASSPTGGVGCNPAEFVKDARAALAALAALTAQEPRS